MTLFSENCSHFIQLTKLTPCAVDNVDTVSTLHLTLETVDNVDTLYI